MLSLSWRLCCALAASRSSHADLFPFKQVRQVCIFAEVASHGAGAVEDCGRLYRGRSLGEKPAASQPRVPLLAVQVVSLKRRRQRLQFLGISIQDFGTAELHQSRRRTIRSSPAFGMPVRAWRRFAQRQQIACRARCPFVWLGAIASLGHALTNIHRPSAFQACSGASGPPNLRCQMSRASHGSVKESQSELAAGRELQT